MSIDKSFEDDHFTPLENAEVEKGAVPILVEIDNAYLEYHPAKYFICARTQRINEPPNGAPLPKWVEQLKFDKPFCLFTAEQNYDKSNQLEMEFFRKIDNTLKKRQLLVFVTHVNTKKNDTVPPAAKKSKTEPEYQSKYHTKGYFVFKFARCPRAM
jgi:hypothetical protein